MDTASRLKLLSLEDARQPRIPETGAHELLWASLIDVFAVRDAVKAGQQSVRLQRQQDLDWLREESVHIFSFVWLCRHLGLDPTAVRRAYYMGVPLPFKQYKAK
jgi:hypothetical protein